MSSRFACFQRQSQATHEQHADGIQPRFTHRHALHKLHLAERGHPRRLGLVREKRVGGDEDRVCDIVPSSNEVVDELVCHVVLLLEHAKHIEALQCEWGAM